MNDTALAPVSATAAENLAEQINTWHRRCVASAGESLSHAMRCGDLLMEAKVRCTHGQWQQWLADNFEGSARTGRLYMQLAERRAELEAKTATDTVLTINEARRLIGAPKAESDADALLEQVYKPDPTLIPARGSLLFQHELVGGGCDYLWIEPATETGYYFVSLIRLGGDGGMVEGTKRPIIGDAIRFAIEGLAAERTARVGERHELSDAAASRFNRWLFDSYEHYQAQMIAGWKGAS